MWMLLFSDALAFDTIGATWPDDAFPIPYWVSDDLGPDLDDEATIAAIAAAFDTWAAVDCAGLSFSYEGRVADASFGEAPDGKNEVFIVTKGWPDDSALLSSPLVSKSGGRILEADFALNAQSFSWSVDGDGITSYDVQGAVTHEVGHLLGLWHTTVSGATLNPAMDGQPDARSLETDDIAGICSLYAAGTGDTGLGQGSSCVTSADCPDGFSCVLEAGAQYCAAACETDADCSAGTVCEDPGYCVNAVAGDEGCGCGRSASPSWIAAIGAAGLVVRRRRSMNGT